MVPSQHKVRLVLGQLVSLSSSSLSLSVCLSLFFSFPLKGCAPFTSETNLHRATLLGEGRLLWLLSHSPPGTVPGLGVWPGFP